MTNIPNILIVNDVVMPILGLGTYQGPPGKEMEVKEAVKDAIDLGYRLFDCAHVYSNESYIGEAIQEKIKEGVVKREELFIVSKLWSTSHKPELVEIALNTTLQNLQLDYLDLYLIHWPQSFKEGDVLHPKDDTGKYILSDEDYLDTWKAMEELYCKKLVRAIGVSNFNSKQIERLLQSCSVIPAINQIECHPYLNQKKLRQFCESHGIKTMSYRPLGAPSRTGSKPEDPGVLNDPKVKEISERYGKSPAQILIRYNIQLGSIVIPKSSNKGRLKQNMDVFDFSLAPEDMAYINTFDCGGRTCLLKGTEHSPYYPYAPEVEF